MRPVRRNISPQTGNFSNYEDAQPFLVSRLGPYCSYCERKIVTSLAVEHIEPKDPPATSHLIGTWTNYLLACVNCNSTKKDKTVDVTRLLLPDRDNTFLALEYQKDGQIVASTVAQTKGLTTQVEETLALTGLDKPERRTLDENGKLIALDRASQRMEAWGEAQAVKQLIGSRQTPAEQELIKKLVLQSGFFSIWMAVFQGDTGMRNMVIDAFPGTRGSGCFDAMGAPVSPALNPDKLAGGGKI